MKKQIDTRSDTVTQPPLEMRQTMVTAALGDDGYRDDPTVLQLESMAAEICGKEAGLFVASGVMGNQLALFTHCNHGDEVILAENCHIVDHELGASAVISGVQLRTLPAPDGMMSPDAIKAAIRHCLLPKTKLICLENAHSLGIVHPLEYMAAVRKIADENGIAIHLDGARLFNAALYLGVEPKVLASYADSVMFCLSKGLCAPVGSVLVGTREFIAKATPRRKIMGGEMRQAGVLAAPGIYALQHMRARLQTDHDNAQLLAQLLAQQPALTVSPEKVHINMVYFGEAVAGSFAKIEQAFMQAGILFNPAEHGVMRLATHYGMEESDVRFVVQTIAAALA
ncbi:MAG: GntG family PLP-dependent aldolase [Oscillospiraceae bacterium]|nr:GntG family PLP-dependent aldolase [Oscillospiraceae bacterium]